MSDDTLLCGEHGTPNAVSVRDYKAWEKELDHGWSKKPAFIRQRLRERFIEPILLAPAKVQHGFRQFRKQNEVHN
jgi:hypothetical protein